MLAQYMGTLPHKEKGKKRANMVIKVGQGLLETIQKKEKHKTKGSLNRTY